MLIELLPKSIAMPLNVCEFVAAMAPVTFNTPLPATAKPPPSPNAEPLE